MKLTEPMQGAASTESVVVVRGLTKVFKDFWGRPKAKAVDNVDFEVRRGEVFGLLGPNGSGKSTTVKMLLGLLYPTRGHVEVFGHSPRHVATKSRIGYLPRNRISTGFWIRARRWSFSATCSTCRPPSAGSARSNCWTWSA